MKVTKPQRRIVAGEKATGVWCVPCNAPVAVRVPLHIGDVGQPSAAELTVCASSGTRFIPVTPQVTLTAAPRPRWRRPRPWLPVTLTPARLGAMTEDGTLSIGTPPMWLRRGWLGRKTLAGPLPFPDVSNQMDR